jgi:hypothetical protein
MGIFDKLKNYFKTEDFEVHDEQLDYKAEPQEIKPTRPFNNNECSICHNVIGQDRYSKQGGQIYHKKCFKQFKKISLGNNNG